MFHNIIIVCTGNICRSPMAEAMLRSHPALPEHCEVSSAGTGAVVGSGPSPDAVAVMRTHGYDITEHIARQATAPMLGAADLILTLDQSHSDWINKRYPQLRGRVHKLLKWHGNADIADPFMRPREEFERTYEEISLGLADWAKRLG